MTAKLFKIIKSKRIKNKNGDIIKFLNRRKNYFKGFGELYFSTIKKGKVKGWNCHKRNICLLCIPQGKVVFFFKKKLNSKKFFKVKVEDKENKLIQIFPRTWFAFFSKTKISLISNFMNKLHDNKETLKSPIQNIKNFRKFYK